DRVGDGHGARLVLEVRRQTFDVRQHLALKCVHLLAGGGRVRDAVLPELLPARGRLRSHVPSPFPSPGVTPGLLLLSPLALPHGLGHVSLSGWPSRGGAPRWAGARARCP